MNVQLVNYSGKNRKEFTVSETNDLSNIKTFDSFETIYDQGIYSEEKVDIEMDIYKISNRMVELQKVYDHGLITVWYPDMMSEGRILKDRM